MESYPTPVTDNAKCSQVAAGRHRLAFKLEGVPHLSTTLPKVQWKGIADLVCKFWPTGELASEKYLNTILD